MEGTKKCLLVFVIFLLVWAKNPRTFFSAYKRTTDNGVCCHIIPYFDFEVDTGNEPERSSSFVGRKWKPKDSIKVGAKAGLDNGLELWLDAESFDMVGSLSPGFTGFTMALEDPQDVPFTKDHAKLIASGRLCRLKNCYFKTGSICHKYA